MCTRRKRCGKLYTLWLTWKNWVVTDYEGKTGWLGLLSGFGD
jgi:hypothetical protein